MENPHSKGSVRFLHCTTEKAKGKKDDDDDDEGSLAQKAKMKADAEKVKQSKSCATRCLPFSFDRHLALLAQIPCLILVHSASQTEKVSQW